MVRERNDGIVARLFCCLINIVSAEQGNWIYNIGPVSNLDGPDFK